MIAPELLEVLCCPADRSAVRLATAEELEALNARIAGGVKNNGGAPAGEKLEAAIIRVDGTFAYPVREDIPVMLIDEASTVDDAEHDRLVAKAEAEGVPSTLSEG